ncbi:MAG: transposase [Pseudonocardia sp.]|nr:transposase [Pseudonocardia sp.]
MNTQTGEVIGDCYPRRRTDEFITFMDQVVATYKDQELHVVLDNLSTHKGDTVNEWLTKHPKVTFHLLQQAAPDSTKWRSGSASSPSGQSDAEPSRQSSDLSIPSTTTSRTGTRTQSHLPGPLRLTRSSPKFD